MGRGGARSFRGEKKAAGLQAGEGCLAAGGPLGLVSLLLQRHHPCGRNIVVRVAENLQPLGLERTDTSKTLHYSITCAGAYRPSNKLNIMLRPLLYTPAFSILSRTLPYAPSLLAPP